MTARRKPSRKPSPRAKPARAGAADCHDEAKHFERTLRANRQVADGSGPLPPGATHVEEQDDEGRTRVKRKRFSAV
jgi:hypothetical protein